MVLEPMRPNTWRIPAAVSVATTASPPLRMELLLLIGFSRAREPNDASRGILYRRPTNSDKAFGTPRCGFVMAHPSTLDTAALRTSFCAFVATPWVRRMGSERPGRLSARIGRDRARGLHPSGTAES